MKLLNKFIYSIRNTTIFISKNKFLCSVLYLSRFRKVTVLDFHEFNWLVSCYNKSNLCVVEFN